MIWIFISKIMFIDTNSRNIFSVGISFQSTGTQSTKHGQVRTIKTSNVFILQSPIFSRCLHRFFIFKKITRINWIKSVLNLTFIFIKTKKKTSLENFSKRYLSRLNKPINLIYLQHIFEFKECSRDLQCLQALPLSVFRQEQTQLAK